MHSQVMKETLEFENFEAITPDEILSLWRTFKASGLSDEHEAWLAIVTGMALDIAFARTETHKRAVQ